MAGASFFFRATLILATVVLSSTASAHVKWFAPYIIDAPPEMLGDVVRNIWMWAGVALVLGFFIATRLVKIRRFGASAL